MGHDHSHDHGHDHGHDHSHGHDHDSPHVELPEWADASVPDSELSPRLQSRRQLLRNAGLLGAGVAAMGAFGPATSAAAAAAEPDHARGRRDDRNDYVYLVGDHHIHTQHSSDGQYRVLDHTRRAAQFGVDWMVITDHGSVAHAKIGVDKVNPDIKQARAENPRTLVFQGLEWNIPAAEHGTVFVAPGPNEVEVLKQFENTYDGVVNSATDGTPGGPVTAANEALAISGLKFLAEQKKSGKVDDVLMFANHPARKGIDSPHEIRAWQSAASGIAMGFEGAPGHQAAAIPGPGHETNGRGYYDNSPSAQSFPGYPLESYVTWGGFDWMTATVGGLWDSLLSEGRRWWITANSDSHQVYNDTLVRGAFDAGKTFDTEGRYPNPTESYEPNPAFGDFWPGYYSRTHVGATAFGYRNIMSAMRAGRVWVDHGQLIDSVEVRLSQPGTGARGVTLGGTLRAERGKPLLLSVTITTASRPNLNGVVPHLNRVDAIRGRVNGVLKDKDTFTTPNTKVVKSWDTSGRKGVYTLTQRYTDVYSPFYIRLRGTDGNREQPGLLGASIDPYGPAADVRGDADPWKDLWFYTNPIFVDVR